MLYCTSIKIEPWWSSSAGISYPAKLRGRARPDLLPMRQERYVQASMLLNTAIHLRIVPYQVPYGSLETRSTLAKSLFFLVGGTGIEPVAPAV